MFSKQVIADIVCMLPAEHAGLDLYLIKFDLDDKVAFDDADSIKKKKVELTKYLIRNQGIKDNHGNDIMTHVVEDRINYLLDSYGAYTAFDKKAQEFVDYPDLYKHLRLDGYDIDFKNKKLIRYLSEDFNVQEKEDYIIKRLDEYHFSTTKGHYEQAQSSYIGANYAAVNGQLRTYTESLFMDMASYIKAKEASNMDISNIEPTDAIKSMQILAKCKKPIIEKHLNEWTGDSKGFIESFWKRLHPEGSHPGLPSDEEVIFRFQLVILNTSNLLHRFGETY
jgi:hypothetical protein